MFIIPAHSPAPRNPDTDRIGTKSWIKPYLTRKERRQLVALGAQIVGEHKLEQQKEAKIQKLFAKNLSQLEKTLEREGQSKSSFLDRQRNNVGMAAAIAVVLCVTGAGAVSNGSEQSLTPSLAAEGEMSRFKREFNELDDQGNPMLEALQANTLYLSENPSSVYGIKLGNLSITIPVQRGEYQLPTDSNGDTVYQPI
jgi:hypothetical protein